MKSMHPPQPKVANITLYPPILSESLEEEHASNDETRMTSSSPPSFMPAQLTANFAELKKLAAQKRKKNSERPSDNEISHIHDDNQKQIIKDDHHERLAEETAILAAREIEKMKNAVAELEAMVAGANNTSSSKNSALNSEPVHNNNSRGERRLSTKRSFSEYSEHRMSSRPSTPKGVPEIVTVTKTE